jgi:predicted GIY-YIG superfamily endonuclease
MKTSVLLVVLAVILACVYARRAGGIYQYVNRATGVPAYIGTTNNLNRRYNEHAQRPFANTNTHQYVAVNMNGSAQRYKTEAAMIQSCKSNGGCTYNKNKGGGGPR